MSTVSSITSTDSTSSSSDLSSVAMTSEDFYKLLIAEVNNQDPTEPMSNQELTQQLMQMQNTAALSDVCDSLSSLVESNESLNETFSNYLSSMNGLSTLSSATSMIGKTVSYTNSEGTELSGEVDQVKVDDGNIYLVIGGSNVLLDDVTSIQ